MKCAYKIGYGEGLLPVVQVLLKPSLPHHVKTMGRLKQAPEMRANLIDVSNHFINHTSRPYVY